MRSEDVEIFSDMTNAAVMRHPGRKFPGILVQGDNLHAMCLRADVACEKVGRGTPGYEDLNGLRNTLWSYLNHYKSTLDEHGIGLPFSEDRRF
ncbi:DUF6959 family protein [Rhizobium leguminosarum]